MSITGIYTCPNCGHTVSFKHSYTNVKVCDYCRQQTLSVEEGLLQTDKSYRAISGQDCIIQPGTRGSFKGKDFEVLGRYRLWFSETVYNYWTIIWEDGTPGLLAEGYGQYAIYQKYLPSEQLKKLSWSDKYGDTNRILSRTEDYYLQSREPVYHWDVEGEVELPGEMWQSNIGLYHTRNGEVAEVIKFRNGSMQAYKVLYDDFEAFKFKNLRAVGNGKSIDCKFCDNSITIRSFPYAQSCACGKCGNRYNWSNRQEEWVAAGKRSEKFSKSVTALHNKASIDGTEYELVGMAVKQENAGGIEAQWREYTLYSPQQGYAFLNEYAGHWIFVKEMTVGPILSDKRTDDIYWQNESYQLYNKYSFKVVEATGEFAGNTFNDEVVAREFISPPEMLVHEKGSEGINWYKAEHIDAAVVGKFGIQLPAKMGVGAIEPKGYINPRKIVVGYLVALLVLFLVNFISTAWNSNKEILHANLGFEESYGQYGDGLSVTPDTALAKPDTKTFTSQPFTLTKWRSNLEFDIAAPVDNSWVALSASLVNTVTGAEYSIEQGVEYYHGYSDGESWSEGNNRERAYLTSIPAGKYILQLTGMRESGKNIPSFAITVNNDVSTIRNVWIMALLLLIWPVVTYFSMNRTEKNRWYNSPFSPYSYED